MPSTSKVSISLPHETLATADRRRRATGETRSEFFRRAIELLLRSERERAAVERYVAGYVAEPEEAYDAEASERLAADAFAAEPWD